MKASSPLLVPERRTCIRQGRTCFVSSSNFFLPVYIAWYGEEKKIVVVVQRVKLRPPYLTGIIPNDGPSFILSVLRELIHKSNNRLDPVRWRVFPVPFTSPVRLLQYHLVTGQILILYHSQQNQFIHWVQSQTRTKLQRIRVHYARINIKFIQRMASCQAC